MIVLNLLVPKIWNLNVLNPNKCRVMQSKVRFIAVVLNLGSIKPQGFGESVSGVQRQEILSNKSKKNIIHATHFIFATTKGSMNACMELVGFSTSSKVKNHWYR